MSERKARIDLDRFLRLIDRLLVLLANRKDPRHTRVEDERQRVEFPRSMYFIQRLILTPHPHEAQRVPVMRARVVRIELDRALELLFSVSPITVVLKLDVTKSGMRFAERIVNCESSGDRRFGLRKDFACRKNFL